MKNLFTIALIFFSIANIFPQDIEVVSPNGGELWGINTLQEIKWNSSGVTNVKIEYTPNSDTTWETIIESISASVGSYYWMVPDINSKFCKIKISDAGNPLIFDKSDALFSIKKLSETEPNNTAAEANIMDIKDSLDCSINPVGDIDYFKFYGNTNDTLEIILKFRNNSELTGYIYLFHESGNQMANEYFYYYNDYERIPFIVPYAGNYFIRISYNWGEYPNKPAAETGDYRIILKKYAFAAPQITDFGYYDTYYNSTRVQIGFYSNRLNTQVRLEYGLTDSYGSTLEIPDTANDVYLSYLTAKVIDLTPNSTYHLRAIAENDLGTAYSEDYIFYTPELPENWTIRSYDTLGYLKDVSFYDENNGYAIDNYNVLKSTDGGNSWIIYPLGDYVVKVLAVNENVAYILTSYQAILKTTNGGSDWVSLDTGVDEDFNNFFFIDENNGVIVGDYGTILRTTNGGGDWLPVTSGTTEYLYSVCLTDLNNGWIAGDNGIILNTIDGGANWNPQVSGTTSDINEVCFITSQLGLAATRWDEEILVTTNGGATWTAKPLPDNSYYPQISFVDMNNIVYVNRDGIFHTSDAGATWTPQKIGTRNYLYGVSKVGNGWIVVGDYGTILKSSFGVVSVDRKNEIPTVFSLKQNYPNPFNPGTKIIYSIPKQSFVSLKIYDILGKEVIALINEEQPLGTYEVDFDASNFSAGVYFYKLQAGNFVQTKKMMLLK
jgi:photosystem II stability/assembly factor-like uncharacterized protein